MKMRILILGVGGFIGSNLVERILKEKDWHICGIDLKEDKVREFLGEKRFEFKKGDATKEKRWVEEEIRRADLVIPLFAIATPAIYVKDPLRVFKLDFEENLKIVRLCVKYRKRLIFPSTSEVYGMCEDREFDEDRSKLVVGPIKNQRWIYSVSKQLLDRVIYAYGQREGLNFTIFRPFNWIGPKLDELKKEPEKEGSSRVVTQFISDLLFGRPIRVVGGGRQRRCFTYIDDGIECLVRIIENGEKVCNREIINIGNPENEASILEIAKRLREIFLAHEKSKEFGKIPVIVEVKPEDYYGEGYEDIVRRVPSIEKAKRLLNWKPTVGLDEALRRTFEYYLDLFLRNGRN